MASSLYIFFFFLFYVYIQPFGFGQTFSVFSIHGLTWPYALYFIHFCLILPLLLGATFGFLPPEFIQVGFHLLGHFSVPIPVPFPSSRSLYIDILIQKLLVRSSCKASINQ